MTDVLDSFEMPSLDDGSALNRAIEKMRRIYALSSYPVEEEKMPRPIPTDGCSREEVDDLEAELGHKLPSSYREFLLTHRYLALSDGVSVLGIHKEGEVGYGGPWLSSEHEPGKQWLVVGKYWRYADGDDLLMEVATGRIYAYLHEYEGKIEPFADSIQKAVYRMVNEVPDDEYRELYEFDDEI
jgi:hypothetical protein